MIKRNVKILDWDFWLINLIPHKPWFFLKF